MGFSYPPSFRACAPPYAPFTRSMHLSPVIRLQAPGQAPEAPPDPIKSGQAKVKANRRAAGGSVRIRFLTERAPARLDSLRPSEKANP